MTNISSKPTDFSATDSALGYLYQVRLAFLSSLQRIRRNEEFCVYVETLDDVVFESRDTPMELLQLKHHNTDATNLSDASSDFWKSLRIWIEGRNSNQIPEEAQLFLITTSPISEKSALKYLVKSDHIRNEEKALKGLCQTIKKSKSIKNCLAYNLFKCLTEEEKKAIIQSIVIVPYSPNISEIKKEIFDEIRLSVRRNHLDSFAERIEGWWFLRTLEQMKDPKTKAIHSNEINSKMDEIRDQFKRDALPIDEDIFQKDIQFNDYETYVFIHQLNIVHLNPRKKLRAVQDYYRASTQRSRWTREYLLSSNELSMYEKSLQENWEIEFEDATENIFTDEEKINAAKNIYRWAETNCQPIRSVNDTSLTRGSLHILSDQVKIGWHPDFEILIKLFLKNKERNYDGNNMEEEANRTNSIA